MEIQYWTPSFLFLSTVIKELFWCSGDTEHSKIRESQIYLLAVLIQKDLSS